jgi:hypothetical protein
LSRSFVKRTSPSNAEAAKDAKKEQHFSAAFAAFAFQGGVSQTDTLTAEPRWALRSFAVNFAGDSREPLARRRRRRDDEHGARDVLCDERVHGTKNVGFNYGLLLLAWGVAGILGPFLGGRMYVATGEYRWAFYVAAMVSTAALGTLSLAKHPHAEPARAVRVGG